MSRLDSLIKIDIVSAPETVSSQFISEVSDVGGVEEAFFVSLAYNGGSSVNMDLYLEVSIDGENFSPLLPAQNIVDDSGSHMWDIIGTGAEFCRVRIEVNSGSIELQSIKLSGKRRH
jgi:hypothetical protein